VTSVRDGAEASLPRPAGPRCICGTPITHTPGKRPRVYCSPACKKRGQRLRARIEREAADGARPAKRDALGKETTEFRAPLSPAETSAGAKPVATAEEIRERRSNQRRTRRYAGRRTLWQITGDKSCRGCGRTLMDPEAGVVFARTSEGAAVALGLLKCGRIWFCPVCSAKIRHGRAEEITRAVVSWIEQGGQAYLVTFTARHAAAHQLADLMDAIQGTRADAENGIKRRPGAYQRLITGSTWAGRKASAVTRHGASEGIRGRVGYVGMIRATEVTLGEGNGWHPHIHAIVFVGGRTEGQRADKHVVGTFVPPAPVLEEWQQHFRSVWTRHLHRVDPAFRPSDEHGVDFKKLRTVRDAKDLGEYIAKTQDGKDPANELARGDLKGARGGNMTPFEMLGRIGDLTGGVDPEDADGHGTLTWCLARWAEYETAMTGRRAIEWTRYLRPLLGLDGGDTEEDDLDVLFEMEAAHEFRDGVQIQERAWHKLTGRALDLAVIEAVEGDELHHATVTELAVQAGSIKSAVRVLGPAEVTELQDAFLATLALRREAAAERRRQEAASADDATRTAPGPVEAPSPLGATLGVTPQRS
jgi:hypothetical protein